MRQEKTPPLGFTEVEEIRKRDVRVVFQGVEGAYSHAAVRMYFGEDADAYHVEKFEDTIGGAGEGAGGLCSASH